MEYIPFLRTDFANIAVIFDPRLKNEYFVEHDNLVPLHRFKKYFQENYLVNTVSINTTEPTQPAKKSLLSSIYKKKDPNQDPRQTESEDTDVLSWWILHTTHFPQLSKMALEILSIPATSVPSEQAFSKSGNLITKRRNRLGNKTIRASMCLSSWLNILK